MDQALTVSRWLWGAGRACQLCCSYSVLFFGVLTFPMARILQDVGTTSLHIASREGHDAVVRTLLASGAALNQTRTVSGCSVQLSVDAETNWS